MTELVHWIFTGATQLAAGGGSTCALDNGAQVWCWGNNWVGQLGNATTDGALHPVVVPSLNGVTRIAAGNSHVCALDTEETLWCWGWSAYGQVGYGGQEDVLEPIAVMPRRPGSLVGARP